MKETSVCFTGHRNLTDYEKNRIEISISDIIKSLCIRGFTKFYCGGAVGFDMIAALAVLDAKNNYPDIKLNLILPYKGQERYWSLVEKANQELILTSADSIEYVYERYLPGCFHSRNRRLVDSSSICVGYLTKQSGGTYFTIQYAQKNGLEIIMV